MKLPIKLEDSCLFSCRFNRPDRFTPNGFTLIEIVVVLGIIAVIGVIGLNVGISSIQKYVCRSQFELLRSTLFYARSEAITSGEGSKVGLSFGDNGSSKIFIYLNNVEVNAFEFDKNFEVVFLENEIVFTRKNFGIVVDVAADSTAEEVSVDIVGPACEKSLNLNKNGAIIW